MTPEQLHQLKTGDIIRHSGGGHPWIVIANYGERVTAVQSADITNPGEWELVLKADHKQP